MDAASLRRALSQRLQRLPRKFTQARKPDLDKQDVQFASTVGYQLSGRITRPDTEARAPGLVVSPAIHQGRAELERMGGPVTADELASVGYTVLTFDPAGRGDSWGEEDFGGPEHQDDLRRAVEHLARVTGGPVGVLSLSLGLAAAVGALARHPDLPVRWLVDWEGPCDRETITAGGTRMDPAAGHRLDDEDYWHSREAVRHVPKLRCGYVRMQALPDHAQPLELRHAERMMRTVQTGSLPWFQLNDHPRGSVPSRPTWLDGGTLAANLALLRKLAALSAG